MTRQPYDAEVNARAVAWVARKTKPARVIAEELGVSRKTFCEQARPRPAVFLMTVLEAELAPRETQRCTRLPHHRRHRVLFGPVGSGNSPRATAVGVRACEPGDTVRCFTVTDWVLRLSAARRVDTLERLQPARQRAAWLILDEWGDVPVDRDGS